MVVILVKDMLLCASECMTSDIDKVTKYSSRHPPIHSAEKPLSVRKCHVLFIFNVSVTHKHMYNVNHFKKENIDIIPLKLLSHGGAGCMQVHE